MRTYYRLLARNPARSLIGFFVILVVGMIILTPINGHSNEFIRFIGDITFILFGIWAMVTFGIIGRILFGAVLDNPNLGYQDGYEKEPYQPNQTSSPY